MSKFEVWDQSTGSLLIATDDERAARAIFEAPEPGQELILYLFKPTGIHREKR